MSNRGTRPSSPNACSEVDGLATAARALRVRVVELEPVPHHAAHEVELHAAEIHEALRIDDDRYAVRREHFIRRPQLLRPLEDVREPRAPATAHADANLRIG